MTIFSIHNQRRTHRAASLVLLLVFALSLPTRAITTANTTLSAVGTATIDGVMSPGEWTTAASVTFPINVPVSEGGGTVPGTLYVMNDSTQLYFALKVPRPAIATSSFVMEFDHDNDGVPEPGDDAFVFNASPDGPPVLFDDYRYTCPDAPVGSAGCSDFDDADGGTTDGAGAVTVGGGFTVFEVSRPLNNTDNAHDFSLNPGDKIGFKLYYRVIVGGFPNGFGDSVFPLEGGAEIMIANPVIPVAIDILPNSINLKNPSKLKVVVLTTPSFNADFEVNPNSIRFGVNGTNALPLPGQSRKADIDGDGDLDWVFQFAVANTGIICTSTEARLTGKTIGGTSIEGVAPIRTTGCR